LKRLEKNQNAKGLLEGRFPKMREQRRGMGGVHGDTGTGKKRKSLHLILRGDEEGGSRELR